MTLWNRVRNEEVRRRVHVEKQLSERVDQSVLRWFGHMEQMDEERMVKRVMNADVEGNRAGFPKLFQAATPLASRKTPSAPYPINTCELFFPK